MSFGLPTNASISNDGAPNFLQCHWLKWPLINSQPSRRTPGKIWNRLARSHKAWQTALPAQPLALTQPFTIDRAGECGGCVLSLTAQGGLGFPLNNKTGNFLCPGNVPLVTNVILISRLQCTGPMLWSPQDSWGTVAKCFPFFLCLGFKAWPLWVEFNQVTSQMPH